MNKNILAIILSCISFFVYCQGGASAEFDAKHAFDEEINGGGRGFGFFGYIIMLIIFLVGLTLWARGDEKK